MQIFAAHKEKKIEIHIYNKSQGQPNTGLRFQVTR